MSNELRYSPLPWRQGRLLDTPLTKRWPEEVRADHDALEKLRVFTSFTSEDQGRSRLLVATCVYEEDARRIAACVNACEGISTELLESGSKPKIPLTKRIKDV